MAWWDELADDELLARLINRGVNPIMASVAVIGRDSDDDMRAAITAELGDCSHCGGTGKIPR